MPEESTTPDLVELVRSMFESMDREFDFDAIAGFGPKARQPDCLRRGHGRIGV